MSTLKDRQAKLAAAREEKDDDIIDDEGGEDTPRVREPATPHDDLEVRLEDEPSPKADGDDPPSRADKKRNRFRENQVERDQFANLFEQERQTNQRLLDHLERLTKQTKTEPTADPLGAELEGVQAQLDALATHARAIGDKMTPEQEVDFTRKARALRRREQEIFAEDAAKKVVASQRPNATPEQVMRQARIADLQDEFDDVYSYDPQRNGAFPALRWAQGRFHQLVAKHGRESMKILKQAMADAQEEFGFKRREASPAHKSKFAGPGRGTAGGSDERTVVLSPAAQRLRAAQFSHIKDKGKRLQAMAKAKKAAIARKSA